MVDEQPVLQVLPRVGEADAVQLGVPARPGVPDRRRQPDQRPAERHRDVLVVRVPAERGVVRRYLDRVVVPVSDRDDREVPAVPDHDLDVVGVGRAAALVQDHGRPPVRLDVDHDMTSDPDGICRRTHRAVSFAPPRHVDDGRAGGNGLLGHGHDERPGRRLVRSGADPVRREEGRRRGRGTGALDVLNRDLRGGVPRDGDPVAEGRLVVQAAQAAQRGEPPLLLAPAGYREVRRVLRPERVHAGNRGGLHHPADGCH